MATAWRYLEYAELEAATEGFATLLGSGGFAHCFKGKLPDGTLVAVKRVKEGVASLGSEGDVINAFMTEVRVKYRRTS